MRVLLDTNVLVAAFATRGFCFDILQVVLAEHQLLVGETVLQELERTLAEKLLMPPPRVIERSSRSFRSTPKSWFPLSRSDGRASIRTIDGSWPPRLWGKQTSW